MDKELRGEEQGIQGYGQGIKRVRTRDWRVVEQGFKGGKNKGLKGGWTKV